MVSVKGTCVVALMVVVAAVVEITMAADAPQLTSTQMRLNADGLVKKGRYSQAIEMYTQASKLDPLDPMNYYKRALVKNALGQSRSAVFDLSRALEVSEDFGKGYLQRGNLYLKMGAFEDAERDLKRAGELGESVGDALGKVAVCRSHARTGTQLAEAGNHASALSALSAAVECAPISSSLRLRRAEAYAATGNLEQAIGDAQRAAKLQSTDLAPRLLVAQLRYRLGELEASLGELQECLRSDQDHKGCRGEYKKVRKLSKAWSKGQAALSKGGADALELAVTKFEFCLGVESELPVYVVQFATHLCRAQHARGEHEAAIAACAQALAADANHLDAMLHSGEAMMAAERFEEAVQMFTRAQQAHSGNQRVAQGLHKAKRLLHISLRKDYYKILEVPKDATARQVKSAYRRLARVWHPDKAPTDEEKEVYTQKFRDIAKGKEILTDPETRRRYDAGEDVDSPQGGGGGGGGGPFGFQHAQGGGQRFTFRWG